MRAAAVIVGLVLATAGCSAGPTVPAAPSDPARSLADEVTVDRVYDRLRQLADLKGGRADGTPGYDAAVDYVANALRDNGFDVDTPENRRLDETDPGKPTLTVGGRSWAVDQASLLVPTIGLSAVTLRPRKAPGCSPADYDGVDVRGALAVVDDTACSAVDKQNVAVGKGAVGVLMVTEPGADGVREGLFPPGYYQLLTKPFAAIGTDVDAALRRTSAPVRLTLDAKATVITFRNVLAQTKTGDKHHVVMTGAHLDATAGSPGANDNGTGVAAVLETAVRLGGSPAVTNAVRFAFWGGQEAGLAGSTKYLASLDAQARKDVALYLNFDTIGSPNAGYFTYDGDQSGQPNPTLPAASVPAGSAGIERTLAGYLNLAGVRPADMPLGRASDYSPFLAAGIPVGGVTTGTNQRKTALQQRLWGGQVGQPFDPNFQTPRDTIQNVDRGALAITGPAVAFAVGTYAASIDGVNGVPAKR